MLEFKPQREVDICHGTSERNSTVCSSLSVKNEISVTGIGSPRQEALTRGASDLCTYKGSYHEASLWPNGNALATSIATVIGAFRGIYFC